MKKRFIEADEVFKICDQLSTDGRKITNNAIHKITGISPRRADRLRVDWLNRQTDPSTSMSSEGQIVKPCESMTMTDLKKACKLKIDKLKQELRNKEKDLSALERCLELINAKPN